jgi:phage protein D
MTQSWGISVPQPAWELLYNGENITGSIQSMVTEVRWHEAMGGQAAEASFTVQDTERKWMFSNYAMPSDKVEISLGYKGAPLFDAGTFIIDEFEANFPPDKLTIKCTESWMSEQLFSPRSQGFENQSLFQIAQTIALNHGWTLVTDAEPNDYTWERKTQSFQDGGDLMFLQRLADEANYEINIRPPQLIFYSRAALEAAPPSGLPITRQMVKRGSFRYQSMSDRTFTGASVTYLDPKTKQVFSAHAQTTGNTKAVSANILNVGRRVENNAHAAMIATSLLQDHNRWLFQGSLELPGTTAYRAGKTISLPAGPAATGWGIYGGTWIIEEAEHTLRPGSGYITMLKIRTVGSTGSQLIPGGG